MWQYNTEAINACKMSVVGGVRLQYDTPRDDAICFCFDLISAVCRLPRVCFIFRKVPARETVRLLPNRKLSICGTPSTLPNRKTPVWGIPHSLPNRKTPVRGTPPSLSNRSSRQVRPKMQYKFCTPVKFIIHTAQKSFSLLCHRKYQHSSTTASEHSRFLDVE